jgi:hypothetical protein
MRKASQTAIVVLLAIVSFFAIANFREKEVFNTTTFLRRLQGNDETKVVRKTSALNPVIVSLITDSTSINDLCNSFRTLKNAQGHPDAPILVFHLENEATTERMAFFSTCTDRPIFYPTIDLDDFPEGFVPESGVDYTSAQVNRFWTTTIWEHSALAPYDVVMRVDHDSCLSLPNVFLPSFKTTYQNYHSHYFPGTGALKTLCTNS